MAPEESTEDEGMPLTESEATYARVGPLERRAREARGEQAESVTAAELHARYLTDVFRYVLRRVPRQEEAEDITAQVFAAAFEGLSRFRGQCSPFLWLLGIARRQIAIALRRRASRRETLASELGEDPAEPDPIWAQERSNAGGAAAEGPEAAVIRAESRRVLRQLVAELNPDQREALMLQYVERLSAAEIAVVMGRSPASVYSLLKRARAKLYRQGRDYFEE
jgi:RNA polymerase sigma-70 factor (ECF subfamily)